MTTTPRAGGESDDEGHDRGGAGCGGIRHPRRPASEKIYDPEVQNRLSSTQVSQSRKNSPTLDEYKQMYRYVCRFTIGMFVVLQLQPI